MNYETLEAAQENRKEAARLAEETIQLFPAPSGWAGHVKKLYKDVKGFFVEQTDCTNPCKMVEVRLTDEDMRALVDIRQKRLDELNEEFFLMRINGDDTISPCKGCEHEGEDVDAEGCPCASCERICPDYYSKPVIKRTHLEDGSWFDEVVAND